MIQAKKQNKHPQQSRRYKDALRVDPALSAIDTEGAKGLRWCSLESCPGGNGLEAGFEMRFFFIHVCVLFCFAGLDLLPALTGLGPSLLQRLVVMLRGHGLWSQIDLVHCGVTGSYYVNLFL